MKTQIEKSFKHYSPIGKDCEKYTVIREMGEKFAIMIDDLSPDCREKSLAITKIEEAVFWANAGIARNGK